MKGSGIQMPVHVVFSLLYRFRPALGPIQPRTRLAVGPFPGVKRPGPDVSCSSYLVPRLRISGAIHLLHLYTFMACAGTILSFRIPYILGYHTVSHFHPADWMSGHVTIKERQRITTAFVARPLRTKPRGTPMNGLWNDVNGAFSVEERRRTGLGFSPVTDTGVNVTISQVALPENW